MEKRPALGKGLSALIPDAADAFTATPRASLDVDIDQLEPNHYQPRGPIDAAKLDDLARSIRANGVIQPIVVRKLQTALGGRERYQIIAGERRWRAAQHAQLAKVPIVIKDVPASKDEAPARDGADRKHPARRSQSDGSRRRRISGSPTNFI